MFSKRSYKVCIDKLFMLRAINTITWGNSAVISELYQILRIYKSKNNEQK
jgi:hypothetical protein